MYSSVSVSVFLGLVAVQPALAARWDVHIGSLTWGQFGGGATKSPALITTDGESGVCDSIDGRLLRNPHNGDGSGNWACDDCSASDGPWEWDVEWISMTSEDFEDDDVNPIEIKEGGPNGYEVFDKDGNKGGDCHRITEHESYTKCTIGLDIYETVHSFNCDVEW